MSGEADVGRDADPHAGDRIGPDGTPATIDVRRDRRARTTWVVLLGGPAILITHFAVVYLVAEAGCTGDGPGLDALDPPVPVATTVVATVVAALLSVALAAWAHRRWRAGQVPPEHDDGSHPDAALAFAGLLLAGLSLLTVLFVGAPALVLAPC